MISIKQAGRMGRGLFITKSVKKGQIVEVSPCIRILGSDVHTLNRTDLRFYVFASENNDDEVLALGLGSLFNHKKKANVTYDYNPDLNVMVFKATRDIRKGSQLFINYGYDPVEGKEAYERTKVKH